MSFEKIVKDSCGDTATVEERLGEVRVETVEGWDRKTVMYFKPKQAKKLAKALKKAARIAKGAC